MPDKKTVDLRKYTQDGPWKLNFKMGGTGLSTITTKLRRVLTVVNGAVWGLDKHDAALMAAAPDLVRELAKAVLNIADDHLRAYLIKGEKRGFDLFLGANNLMGTMHVIARALQCSPDDITLEALKVIAGVD